MSSSALELSAEHLDHVAHLWAEVKALRVVADDETPVEVSAHLRRDLQRAFLLTKALRHGERLGGLHERSHAQRMALEAEWEASVQDSLRQLLPRLDVAAAWHAAHRGWQAPQDPSDGCLVGAVPLRKRLTAIIRKAYTQPRPGDYTAVEAWGGQRAELAKKALDSGHAVVFRDATGTPTAVAEVYQEGQKVSVQTLAAAPNSTITGQTIQSEIQSEIQNPSAQTAHGLDALREIAKEAAKSKSSLDINAATPAQADYFANLGFVQAATPAAPAAAGSQPAAASQTMNMVAQLVQQLAMQGGTFPASTKEVSAALASGINEDVWSQGAYSRYLGLASKTAEQAGQLSLEQMGLHKTFEFANPANMASDMFGVRGSKVIQNLYGDHMDRLSQIIKDATAPKSPMSIPQVTKRIQEEWPKLSKYQAQRIARTETGSVWMSTATNAYQANGISEWESIVASGPSIEVDTNGACDYCVEQGSFVHDISDTDIPPYHPNCRCDVIPVLEDPETGEPWLPPDEPWAGGGDGSAANFSPTPVPEPGAPTGGLSFGNTFALTAEQKSSLLDGVKGWSTAAKGAPAGAVGDAARIEGRSRATEMVNSGKPLKVMRDASGRTTGVSTYLDGNLFASLPNKHGFLVNRIETEDGSRYAMLRSFAQDTWNADANYLAIDSSVVPSAMYKKLTGMGFKPLDGQPEILYLDRSMLPEVFKFEPTTPLPAAPAHVEVQPAAPPPAPAPEPTPPPVSPPPTDAVPLVGLPPKGHVDPNLRALADQYMKDAKLPYTRATEYVEANPQRATRIAAEYEKMPDALAGEVSPEYKKAVLDSYEALRTETLAQYNALVKDGYRYEFNPQGKDPYGGSPWAAERDIQDNQHAFVFPTEEGYGAATNPAEVAAMAAKGDNPMLGDSGIVWKQTLADGTVVEKPAYYNDVFRAVHDTLGHSKEGVGFRASGEENAWRSHVAMYSEKARGAMTSETRGQNSWVNFGPHAETNATAGQGETVYAEQKLGLMPDWTWREGAGDGMFAVTPEGEIQSVTLRIGEPLDESKIGAALEAAKDQGGSTYVAYGGELPAIAEKHGFKVVGRMEFVDKYAPEGWDVAKYGRPDVFFLALNPADGFSVRTFTDWNRATAYSRALSKVGDVRDAEAADFATAALEKLKSGGYSLDASGNDAKTLRYVVARKAEEHSVPGLATKEDLAAYYKANVSAIEKGKGKVFFGGWHNPEEDVTYLDVSTSFKIKARAEEFGIKENQLAYYDMKTGEDISLVPTEADLPKETLEKIQELRLDGWPQPKGPAAQAIFGDSADTEALFSDGHGNWVPERQLVHEDIVWQFFKDKKLPAGTEVPGVTLTSSTSGDILDRVEVVRAESENWIENEKVNTILTDIEAQIGVTGQAGHLAEWNLAEVRSPDGELLGVMGYSLRQEGEKKYLTVWGSAFRGGDTEAMKLGAKGVAREALGEGAQFQVQTIGQDTMMGKLYPANEYGTHAVWQPDEIPAAFDLQASKPTIYLTSGGGASGKGSSIFTVDGKNMTLDELKKRDDMIVVDPDYIKTLLPEYKTMVDANDMYAASGVHEESSALAKTITKAATEKGYNIVLDTTGSGKNFVRKLENFKAQGYEVKVSMTSIPTREAIVRSISRGEKSGRFVPVRPLTRAHSEASAAFAEWKDSAIVDEWKLYDNTDGRLLVAEKKIGGKVKVYEPVKYNSILAKADEAPPRLLPELPPPAPPFTPSGPPVEGWAYKDGEVRAPQVVPYPGEAGILDYKPWTEGLSAGQRTAIKDWTTSASEFTYKKPLAEIEKFNQNMDSVIASAPAYEEPVTVWRGTTFKPQDVDPKTLNSPLAMGDYLKQKFKVGDVMEPQGFQATSFSPDIPLTFTTGQEKVGEIGVIFEIKATHGAYLGDLSEFKDERELLLSRNEKWSVKRVTQEQFQNQDEEVVNRFVVQVEQVPPLAPVEPAAGQVTHYTVIREEDGNVVYDNEVSKIVTEVEEWPSKGLTVSIEHPGIQESFSTVRDDTGQLVGVTLRRDSDINEQVYVHPFANPPRPEVLLKGILAPAMDASLKGYKLTVSTVSDGTDLGYTASKEFQAILRQRGFEVSGDGLDFTLAADKIPAALPEFEAAGMTISPKMPMPPEPYELNVIPVAEQGLSADRADLLREETADWKTPPSSTSSVNILLNNAEQAGSEAGGTYSHIIEMRDSDGKLHGLIGLEENGTYYNSTITGAATEEAARIYDISLASTSDIEGAKQAIATTVAMMKPKVERIVIPNDNIGLVPEAKAELRHWLDDRGWETQTKGGLGMVEWTAKTDETAPLMRAYELKTPEFGAPIAKLPEIQQTQGWTVSTPEQKAGADVFENLREETQGWFQTSDDAELLIQNIEDGNGLDRLIAVRDLDGSLVGLVGTFEDQVTKQLSLFKGGIVLKYKEEPQEFARAITVAAHEADRLGYGLTIENYYSAAGDSLGAEWVKVLKNMGFKNDYEKTGSYWYSLSQSKVVDLVDSTKADVQVIPMEIPAETPLASPAEAPPISVEGFQLPGMSVAPEDYTHLEVELEGWTDQSGKLEAWKAIQFAKSNPTTSGIDVLRDSGGNLRGVGLYDKMSAEPSVGTPTSLNLKSTLTKVWHDEEGQWALVRSAAERAKAWDVNLKVYVGPGASKSVEDKVLELYGEGSKSGQWAVVSPEDLGKIIDPAAQETAVVAPVAEEKWATAEVSKPGDVPDPGEVQSLKTKVSWWSENVEAANKKIDMAVKNPDFGLMTMTDAHGNVSGLVTYLDPASAWRSFTPVVTEHADAAEVQRMIRGMIESAQTAGRDGIYAAVDSGSIQGYWFAKSGFDLQSDNLYQLEADNFESSLTSISLDTSLKPAEEYVLPTTEQLQEWTGIVVPKVEAIPSDVTDMELIDELQAQVDTWPNPQAQSKAMIDAFLHAPESNPNQRILVTSREGERRAIALVDDKSHVYSSVQLNGAFARYGDAESVQDAIRAAAGVASEQGLPLDVFPEGIKLTDEGQKKEVLAWMKENGAEQKNLVGMVSAFRFDETAASKIGIEPEVVAAEKAPLPASIPEGEPATIYVGSHYDTKMTTQEVSNAHMLVSGWPDQAKAMNVITAGADESATLLEGVDAAGHLRSVGSYVTYKDTAQQEVVRIFAVTSKPLTDVNYETEYELNGKTVTEQFQTQEVAEQHAKEVNSSLHVAVSTFPVASPTGPASVEYLTMIGSAAKVAESKGAGLEIQAANENQKLLIASLRDPVTGGPIAPPLYSGSMSYSVPPERVKALLAVTKAPEYLPSPIPSTLHIAAPVVEGAKPPAILTVPKTIDITGYKMKWVESGKVQEQMFQLQQDALAYFGTLTERGVSPGMIYVEEQTVAEHVVTAPGSATEAIHASRPIAPGGVTKDTGTGKLNKNLAEHRSTDGESGMKRIIQGNLHDRLVANPEWRGEGQDLSQFDGNMYAVIQKAFDFRSSSYGDTGDRAAIGDLIHNWAITSSDGDVRGVALQIAAKEEFGLPIPAYAADYVNDPARNAEIVEQAQQLLDGKGFVEGRSYTAYPPGEHGPSLRGALRAFIRAQYEETQQYLKDLGVEEITVYRGMSLRDYNAMSVQGIFRPGAEIGISDVPVGLHPVLVKNNALASWSIRHQTSSQFASGTMLRASIPRELILSTPMSGFGCAREWEIVAIERGDSVSWVAQNGTVAITPEIRAEMESDLAYVQEQVAPLQARYEYLNSMDNGNGPVYGTPERTEYYKLREQVFPLQQRAQEIDRQLRAGQFSWSYDKETDLKNYITAALEKDHTLAGKAGARPVGYTAAQWNKAQGYQEEIAGYDSKIFSYEESKMPGTGADTQRVNDKAQQIIDDLTAKKDAVQAKLDTLQAQVAAKKTPATGPIADAKKAITSLKRKVTARQKKIDATFAAKWNPNQSLGLGSATGDLVSAKLGITGMPTFSDLFAGTPGLSTVSPHDATVEQVEQLMAYWSKWAKEATNEQGVGGYHWYRPYYLQNIASWRQEIATAGEQLDAKQKLLDELVRAEKIKVAQGSYTPEQLVRVEALQSKIDDIDAKLSTWTAKKDAILADPAEDPTGNRLLSTQNEIDALDSQRQDLVDSLNQLHDEFAVTKARGDKYNADMRRLRKRLRLE